ncbi:MAG: PAS domain-containing sensor histidine kinase [Herpetosiphonaceae bacterium]|nr:PAS domain-containing sensor histidine kinase [Herpetosiphonaceae bacterium]
MTLAAGVHTANFLQPLSYALVTTPPESLAALAQTIAEHTGGGVAVWIQTTADVYELYTSAGYLGQTPAAILPGRLPSSTDTAIWSHMLHFSLSDGATLLRLYNDTVWIGSVAFSTEPAALGILHALLEGWVGRIMPLDLAAETVLTDTHLLQNIVDALPEGVVVGLAPDGKLVLANAMAEQLWGHPLFKVPVDQYDQFGLFHSDGAARKPEDSGIARVLRTGMAVLHEELSLRRPDGSEIPILSNTSPLINSDGSLLGAVAVFQDISAWKRQERERDEAIAAIAHDLKNPLTTIRGSADLLLRRALKEAASDRELGRLRSIIAQTYRMGDYLELLVDVARLHAGELPLAPEPTDFQSLIETIVDALNHSLSEARISFTAHDNPAAYLDPIWMERVVRNLLDNALKYSSADTPIDVSLTASASEITVRFRDYGIGIAKADQQRIFERFARANNSRINGAGLGLYTVHAVVRAHGGTISAESAGLGEGSVFTLVLPMGGPHEITASNEGA